MPAFYQEVSDAYLAAIDRLAAGLTDYADAATPSGLAADDLIRGLLEACGIALGVAATDATSPLSEPGVHAGLRLVQGSGGALG